MKMAAAPLSSWEASLPAVQRKMQRAACRRVVRFTDYFVCFAGTYPGVDVVGRGGRGVEHNVSVAGEEVSVELFGDRV